MLPSFVPSLSPCSSPTLRVGHPPGGLSSVRILAQHEGMGTLHGPDSQPRYDLALATYLYKPRAHVDEHMCTCMREYP